MFVFSQRSEKRTSAHRKMFFDRAERQGRKEGQAVTKPFADIPVDELIGSLQ